MNAPGVLTRPALRSTWRSVPRAAIWLTAGLLVLGGVFHQEITAAIAVWSSSTAYNHCFLVLPIAVYLVWDRRGAVRGLSATPMPAIALAGIPIGMAWLAAERLGIMEGRQLAAMSFVELLFVAVLGWRLSWALAGPLLYLYFLVPFGEFITPRLQDFTTGFVQVGLNLLNIPVYIDGYTIEIPQGSFYIAEACAGLRFLIASLAFGALYSLVMYRSPVRRGLFMLASLIVPVIANGLRALGIVVLGNILGSAKAAATDHVLYGWLFFSIVILILIALGLPFREDERDAEAVPRTERSPRVWEPQMLRRSVLAVASVCVVAVLGPTVALALEPSGELMPRAVASLDLGPECGPAPGTPAGSLQDAKGMTRRLSCYGMVVQLRMHVLSTHVTAGPLFAAERRMLAAMQSEEGWLSAWVPAAPGQARVWRLLETPGLSKAMAVAMWVDGKPTKPGLADRLRMAWTSIVGARFSPVLITMKPEVDWSALTAEQRQEAEHRFIQVLQNCPDLTRQVQRIAGHT